MPLANREQSPHQRTTRELRQDLHDSDRSEQPRVIGTVDQRRCQPLKSGLYATAQTADEQSWGMSVISTLYSQEPLLTEKQRPTMVRKLQEHETHDSDQ